jgi:hypothetical protein
MHKWRFCWCCWTFFKIKKENMYTLSHYYNNRIVRYNQVHDYKAINCPSCDKPTKLYYIK